MSAHNMKLSQKLVIEKQQPNCLETVRCPSKKSTIQKERNQYEYQKIHFYEQQKNAEGQMCANVVEKSLQGNLE